MIVRLLSAPPLRVPPGPAYPAAFSLVGSRNHSARKQSPIPRPDRPNVLRDRRNQRLVNGCCTVGSVSIGRI